MKKIQTWFATHRIRAAAGENLYNQPAENRPYSGKIINTIELVFGLKALYNLAQWQRPEGTTPWVKNQPSKPAP